jgi:hypothetical protein
MAEAWITLALGLILLLMFPRFLQWGSSRLFGTHFDEYALNGAIVPYPQVHDFWPDLGCTLFGLVLVLDGISIALSRWRVLIWVAFLFTLAATGYNLVYLIQSYSQYGLAIVSALGVAFGVYMLTTQWRALRGH